MDNQFIMIVYGLSIFFTSVFGVYLYQRYAMSHGLLDIPNARSSHQMPTPRGAGIVFTGVWLISAFLGYQLGLIPQEFLFLFVFPTLCFSLLGYWDDHKTLSVRRRLFFQFALAFAVVRMMGGIEVIHLTSSYVLPLGLYLGTFLCVVGIVWSVNLFNFMDGLDGIAAIEALFVLGVGGVIAWHHEAYELLYLAWGMVFAVAGFLVWNWPKASVFMGDVGSYCLGGLIAILALAGDHYYQIPMTLWLMLYGVFWLDATLTLIRRVALKKRWSEPHLDHAFHRFHLSGKTQKHVLSRVMMLNAVLSGLALWADYFPEKLKVCALLALALLIGYYTWIEYLKPQK